MKTRPVLKAGDLCRYNKNYGTDKKSLFLVLANQVYSDGETMIRVWDFAHDSCVRIMRRKLWRCPNGSVELRSVKDCMRKKAIQLLLLGNLVQFVAEGYHNQFPELLADSLDKAQSLK